MKRTGIKATDEEIARLKQAANAPVMMVGGSYTGTDPVKMAHALALEHGLPEIPGYYGIDLATGEFMAADNAPLPELADKVQPSARESVERTVGKAVHPMALDRLMELWPEAFVEVRQYPNRGQTVVRIYNHRPPRDGSGDRTLEEAAREAACHPDDQFSRRRGITLAFGRALRLVKEISEGARA